MKRSADHLRLVEPSKPDPKQAVVERVKKLPRPDGIVQCIRCGGRTVMSTWNGSTVKDGRYRAGTLIDDKVCYDCHRKGIFSPMLPDPPRQVT